MLKPFEMKVVWPRAARQENPADATFADLCVTVGDESATTYVDLDDGAERDRVEQPMLYLAEWIVENWWSILWEPEKSDDTPRKADQSFSARHSLSSASHGFALPDVRFIPVGDEIKVIAKACIAQHARVRFTKNSNATLARGAIENALTTFVDSVCSRLPDDIKNPLKADWALIRDTTGAEAQFCRLKGALGLSPYSTHTKIETALDKASDILSADQLLDLCQTATAEDLVRSAHVASLVNGFLDQDTSKVDLSGYAKLPVPSDIQSAPAYKRGYAAAKAIRREFGIDDDDVAGGSRVFEKLQVDWKSGSQIDLKGFSSPISGAIGRAGTCGRMALVHQASTSRRFAAARASFFFLAREGGDRRLLTNAVTRDQQASRAFAAELLVPQSVVRSHAHKQRLSADQVEAIAEEAMVSLEVVRHQATNSGLSYAS